MSRENKLSVGLAALMTTAGVGSPVAAGGRIDAPQPIVIPGEMPSLSAPILAETFSPELQGNQEVIKPDLELFRRIIDASINPQLLGPFLEKIHNGLLENPEDTIAFRPDLGGPGLANQLLYANQDLLLYITDPQGSENFIGQFTFIMQLHKSVNISVEANNPMSGIVAAPIPNYFTPEEQMFFLEYFNASNELRGQIWQPREKIIEGGTPGVFRGYIDEDNMMHSQDATVTGLITQVGVYELSETPTLYGALDASHVLINVQP